MERITSKKIVLQRCQKQEQNPNPKLKMFDFQIPSKSVRTRITIAKKGFFFFYFLFLNVEYFYAEKIELLGSAWSSIVIELSIPSVCCNTTLLHQGLT